MLSYLPQEGTKLSEWADRFVTLAGAFIKQMPFQPEELKRLAESNRNST